MYTTNVNIPPYDDLSDQVGAFLEFFKLADKIDLLGPLTPVSEKFKNILKGSRSNLQPVVCRSNDCRGWSQNSGGWGANNASTNNTAPPIPCVCHTILANTDPLRDNVIKPEHLQAAFELQLRHDARTILVDACVTSYLLSFPKGYRYHFKFQDLLVTLPEFCLELLKAVGKAMQCTNSSGRYGVEVCDPLTGDVVNLRGGTAGLSWGD